MLDSLSDGYLFWRVSEGGMMAPFNSAMPAWKTTLSEEQRWHVISYVRLLGR
jgi:mono/diheme cytochrome c family protein